MADHKEYEIRKKRLETDPLFKNFKEGVWMSPGGKVLSVCVSYEAEMINIHQPGTNWSTSIYPVVWDLAFSEWKYIG